MATQTIINVLLGIAFAGLGWFAREIWSATKELREDLHKIEVQLPENYIRKDEFRDEMKEIKSILNEIFRKIDDLGTRKADK